MPSANNSSFPKGMSSAHNYTKILKWLKIHMKSKTSKTKSHSMEKIVGDVDEGVPFGYYQIL